jgi:ribonuclease E
MLDNEPDTINQAPDGTEPTASVTPARRRRAAVRAAGPPGGAAGAPPIETLSAQQQAADSAPEMHEKKASAKRAATKRAPARKAAEAPADAQPGEAHTPRRRAAKKAATAEPSSEFLAAEQLPPEPDRPAEIPAEEPPAEIPPEQRPGEIPAEQPPAEVPAEQPPAEIPTEQPPAEVPAEQPPAEIPTEQPPADALAEAAFEEAPDIPADDEGEPADTQEEQTRRRRRRRGGRRRRRGAEDATAAGDDGEAGDIEAAEIDIEEALSEAETAGDEETEAAEDAATESEGGDREGQRRRRRRRRRRGEEAAAAPDDPTEVVVRVREPRRQKVSHEVSGIDGSTRMEAKRQRRKEGREAGRRRPPILSEAEFLARRESVARKMIIRQQQDLAQIAVLEDDILVEHYVDRDSAASLIGNVYLGRVQNVLPSMEAAFVDIGRGRNAVLYAGEVDWDAFGAEGQNRKVEKVLKSGQTILVQVSKDPVGAKGARLTNHVSIPGRYIVYAPGGHLSGISRKLPDVERKRLKDILSELVGESASVIVRTAAEGASEEELVRDVNRLKAQWEDIEKKVKAGQAPQLLYAEPDLTVRIVRDLFTEDFSELIIQGNGGMNDAYDSVEAYVSHVAPHLKDRLRRWEPDGDHDLFAEYRLDEQIAKGLERRVFLPSGGSLIIDRTEAMTVIDVNTGKFTGTGGNLEATVTSNNLEAAEEIVRQLRLRDIGGIIVIDFIDMVLPSNRELLLRRLVECLGRDRTRHQVAEVTSLGLVQMTRKRIGTGLLEAFSTECPHCHGRGVELHDMPVQSHRQADGGARDGRQQRRVQSAKSAPPDAEPATDTSDEADGTDAERAGRGRRTRRGRGGSESKRSQPEPAAAG